MIFCLKVSPVNDQTHKSLYETDRMHYNGSVIEGSTHMGSQSGIALVCVCVCEKQTVLSIKKGAKCCTSFSPPLILSLFPNMLVIPYVRLDFLVWG